MSMIQGYTPTRIQKDSLLRFEFTNSNGMPLRARLTMAASLPNMRRKSPIAGKGKYNFKEAVNIDLSAKECFQLSSHFKMFIAGRYPAFSKVIQDYGQTNKNFSPSIYHDPSLNPDYKGAPVKYITMEQKDSLSMYFRAHSSLGEGSNKQINKIIVVLDFWEIEMLAASLHQYGLILQGLVQININPNYTGNITEKHSGTSKANTQYSQAQGSKSFQDIPTTTH